MDTRKIDLQTGRDLTVGLHVFMVSQVHVYRLCSLSTVMVSGFVLHVHTVHCTLNTCNPVLLDFATPYLVLGLPKTVLMN